MSHCELSFQQKGLFQQGYQTYTPAELKQLEWGLRFTPAVCSLITLGALVGQQPYVLLGVALLGMWAFFFPAAHPMDLLYNHGVRHLFGAVKLPPNPFQRRLACFAAGVMNTIAGALLLAGLPLAAWVVGGTLLALQAIVIFTHFCTLSWMYEGLMRLLGLWHRPVDAAQARALKTAGALLVDVRGPDEFARGHVAGALNIPLERLDAEVGTLKERPVLVYCHSGARSQIATHKLGQYGIAVHDLGGIERARATLNEAPATVEALRA